MRDCMHTRRSTLRFFAAAALLICMLATRAAADENAYHWQGERQFFEGWYFKVSDPATQRSFLFIYAVFNPAGTAENCSFIMAGANTPEQDGLIYQRFDLEDFSATHDAFSLSIGDNNRAGGDWQRLRAQGDVADDNNSCSWDVSLEITDSWMPAMGWMANLPDLQTYWHVGAMKARARGWVMWNGKRFDFDNATGYQEKNWGREFPRKWFWLQANNFDDPKACCLSVGAASMPIGPLVFPACGIGLIYDGRTYTFSFPQQPAWIRPDVSPGSWHIEAVRGRHKIVIDASCAAADLLNLANPTERDGIVFRTWETVRASLSFQLYERSRGRWRKIGEASSPLAGAEFGGKSWLGWDK